MPTTTPNDRIIAPPSAAPEGPWALAQGALRALGSLRLTLAVLLVLAAGVAWSQGHPDTTPWAIAAPLGLCAANLLAAIAVHPAFRRQSALLVFHLALLAVVLLAALGRLTFLKGQVELSVGEAFGGRLTAYQAGPWHPWGIGKLRFSNEGFSIDYRSGRRRDHTRNRVRFTDGAGQTREVIIGDQVALAMGGYRFYTTFNKGFALTFVWTPPGAEPQRGTIHLPAFPIHEYRQANTWRPPGSDVELWVQLRFDEPLLPPGRPAGFRTPGSHLVVVRAGEQRTELTPGSMLDIGGGRLVYEGVTSWMGYKVFYDPTLPWLLGACVVAVLSLGIYLWQHWGTRPWDTGSAGKGEGP